MEFKSILAKLSEMETQPEAVEIKEAYIKNSKDAIGVLANLRAMGKQSEHGGQVPPGFAGQVVNDLYDVMQWIEANIREDVTTEDDMEEGNAFAAALANAKEKGDDEFEVDGKKFKVKEDENTDEGKQIDEAMVVQADGAEAMALLGLLKLAGMPHQAATEEREVEYTNTPKERTEPQQAAVPGGNDLNKPKVAYKHSYKNSDNPMAMEELAKIEGKLAKMFETMQGE
jgi:hypothetical protein